MSFDELVKVTVVPVLMQKALLGLAPEILGVALAEDPSLRRLSTEQGEEAEPQVFSAAQNACWIRGRANIVFDLLFGVLTDDVEVQEYGQNEQRSKNGKNTISFHLGTSRRRANITRPDWTPTSSESVDRPLVHAGRALPVEHVDQLPRILVEFELYLS